MLALLWAPLASHCLLESTLSLTSLSCCDHQDMAGQHGNDCHNAACDTVEAGQYRSALQRLTVLPPPLQLHFESPALILVAAEPAPNLIREHPDAARTPPASWQFFFRTALAPRAPSGRA
jgi:hypothetical protein